MVTPTATQVNDVMQTSRCELCDSDVVHEPIICARHMTAEIDRVAGPLHDTIRAQAPLIGWPDAIVLRRRAAVFYRGYPIGYSELSVDGTGWYAFDGFNVPIDINNPRHWGVFPTETAAVQAILAHARISEEARR